MLLRLLLATLFFYSSSAMTAEPKIVVLGDSISAAYGINTEQGWVTLLQKRLQNNSYPHRVVNASVSGDTTRTGLNRLGPILKKQQPAIVIIALGGNDGLRGLPFDEIESSMKQMIKLSRKHGAKVLVTGLRLPPNYGAYYNSRFDQLYTQLSSQYKVGLVPRFLDHVSGHKNLMQEDGIHPRANAQTKILNNVWPHLKPLL